MIKSINIEDLQIKPELVITNFETEDEIQFWEASVFFEDDCFHDGDIKAKLVGYGNCEEEARGNLNLAFQKLIQGVVVAEPATNDDDPFDRDEDMRYRDDPGYNEVVKNVE